MSKAKSSSGQGAAAPMNLKPLYIILVPVIVVIIILNSGYLQKWLTSVTVNGQDYNVVRYNYYYYSAYNDFVEENSENLETLGFDTNTSAKNQQYNEEMTWMDYFCSQGEQRMSEAAYYNELAEAAAYEFTGEELEPVEEKLAQIEQDCLLNGVSMENYMTAYYGAGMTEEAFRQELTYEVQAKAYKAYLQQQEEPSQGEIQSWILAQPDLETYATADLKVIELQAAEDRFTEEVESLQLEALENKLQELTNRYLENPSSFEQLSDAYNDNEQLAQTGGLLENCQKAQVTEEIAKWCFEEERQPDDYIMSVDEENGTAYLVVYVNQGEDAATIQAKKTLAKEHNEAAYESVKAQYEPQEHSLGMLLIGR